MVAITLILFGAACTSPPSPVIEPVAEVAEPAAVSQSETAVEAETDASSNSSSSTGVSAATEKGDVDTSRYDDFEIITLLPPDAIPSIDNPTFHTAAEADDYYEPDELVMGVVFNGDARAYSVPHLSSHEIVNDEVGGVKIAVTW